jgi:hypothetical protein
VKVEVHLGPSEMLAIASQRRRLNLVTVQAWAPGDVAPGLATEPGTGNEHDGRQAFAGHTPMPPDEPSADLPGSERAAWPTCTTLDPWPVSP